MEKMIQESEEYLIHSYNRYPIVLDHGEDVYLVDKMVKSIWILAVVLPYAVSDTATKNLKMH